jgi:ABC-type amino acid transport substrate-binding protein
MKSKAYGWLAAGVLVAGLNASYHDGGLGWLHRTVDQVESNSAAVLALATGRADQFLTEARLVTSQDQAPSCRWATALAQVQTRLVRAHAAFAQTGALCDRHEAQLARFDAQREAQMARFEAKQARIAALIDARNARVGARMAASHPVSFSDAKIRDLCPRIHVSIPNVRVSDSMVDVEANDIDTPVVETLR